VGIHTEIRGIKLFFIGDQELPVEYDKEDIFSSRKRDAIKMDHQSHVYIKKEGLA